MVGEEDFEAQQRRATNEKYRKASPEEKQKMQAEITKSRAVTPGNAPSVQLRSGEQRKQINEQYRNAIPSEKQNMLNNAGKVLAGGVTERASSVAAVAVKPRFHRIAAIRARLQAVGTAMFGRKSGPPSTPSKGKANNGPQLG